MRRLFWGVLAAAMALATTGATAGAQQAGGMMGMRHDSSAMAHMPAIHALIMGHDRIVRTVTDLPDGVRTITESDDPALARRLREHVAEMYRLLTVGADPGLPHTTEALRALFRNKDKIRTTVDTTPAGIVVVQTSTDASIVAALRQHAAEVTEMVRRGREALHAGMMHGGGMMHGRASDSVAGAMRMPGPMGMGAGRSGSTHRFDLLEDGGRIELLRRGDDSTGVAQVRVHLKEIAGAFATGNFSAPTVTHLQHTPGAAVMAARRDVIRVSYGELGRGGEIRFATRDPAALKAIHEFLQAQRREHGTAAAGEHKHPG